MAAGTSRWFRRSTGRSSEVPEPFVSPSFSVGLGCKVKRHQAVESAPYCEGHGGAVQQPVGVAALQVHGNTVCRLGGGNKAIYICALIRGGAQDGEKVMRVVPERSSAGPGPC